LNNLGGSFKGLTPSSSNGVLSGLQRPEPINFRSAGRTRSVGEPGPDEKKRQAEEFVRRLKKDKQEREQQQRMITQAKDNAFLSKLQETVANRKKVRVMQ
jgi:hypothetical protein